MPEDEKPLPRPKKTPFGVNRNITPDEESAQLTADRMAMAMSQGNLDEFIKNELPDNEYARTLAQMMMGMTGMMPSGAMPPAVPSFDPKGHEVNETEIIETLKKQFSESAPESEGQKQDMPAADKKTLDEFIKIASDYSLSIEWLIFRAMRLYVEDHKKTGKL